MIKTTVPNHGCDECTMIKIFQLVSLDWHIPVKEDAINKEVKNITCCKYCIGEELLLRALQDNSSDYEWLIATERY